jgi:hypothetical protein
LCTREGRKRSEGGPLLQIARLRGRPLTERDPERFWQIVSAVLRIALIISVALR